MSMLIIYQKSNGEIGITTVVSTLYTEGSIKWLSQQLHLESKDYALIEGDLLKSVDNKTLTKKGKFLCQN